MTAFFVKTDDSSAGPFTGVELREAALARIIDPDSEIGASPQGPWTRAAAAGLFSSDRLPLPHPEGTHVPDFAIRGFAGTSGRLKLRELIGFAARGMLSPRVMLQSDVSEEWIPINRFPVLCACLSGQLVLLGESGKIHLRSGHHDESDVKQTEEVVHAPVEVAPEIGMTKTPLTIGSTPDAIMIGDQGLIVDENESSAESESASNHSADALSGNASQDRNPRRRFSLPAFMRPSFRIRRRLIINTACLLLVVAGIGAAYSYWRNIGISQDKVIGDWLGGGEGLPAFGVSIRDDGTFVVFNSKGASWTGDYIWGQRYDPNASVDGIEPFSADVEQLAAGFQKGTVLPTDGYIRFQGFIQKRPTIGGRRISDCFLRRDGDNLMLGYLTTVSYSSDQKQLDAGWTLLRPIQSSGQNIVTKLASVEVEPRSVSEFATASTPHLSAAIENLQNWQEDDLIDGDVDNGSYCFSQAVNAEYLLTTFGMPEEARAIYPFEDPQLSTGPSLENAQIVRYGPLSLYLNADGDIQYISLTP